jgi:hypothetical protein
MLQLVIISKAWILINKTNGCKHSIFALHSIRRYKILTITEKKNIDINLFILTMG